jgi:hypothetical protein
MKRKFPCIQDKDSKYLYEVHEDMDSAVSSLNKMKTEQQENQLQFDPNSYGAQFMMNRPQPKIPNYVINLYSQVEIWNMIINQNRPKS